MVNRRVSLVSLRWHGDQLTMGQAVAAATAGLRMLHSASLSLRNPPLFFSFSPSLATGAGTPCSLRAHVSIWPESTKTFVWVLLCKTGCSTTTTQDYWRGGNTNPPPGRVRLGQAPSLWKKRCGRHEDVTTLCVWAKSSSCSFAVEIWDRLVTNHTLLL